MKSGTTVSTRLSGYTLVELLLALVLISIISIAVFTMVAGAAKTSLYVTSGTDTVSQVETAYRRILHNVRTSSRVKLPSTAGTPDTTLTVVTQPDSSNGNATYTVTYSVSNGNLVETDSRYTAPNTLVSGVTAFSVTLLSTSSPEAVQVVLTAGSAESVSRTVTIYCRNL
jgi:prepilin-type N-terminal cleavage/methylation domain-containing protein